MSISLTVQLTEVGGRIDQAAAQTAFNSALLALIAEREVETEHLARAVGELFDQHMGKPIQMPTLGSMVAQKLNAQPENFKVLSQRALDYVRANSQGEVDKATGAEANPTSLFVISKGKGGGCYRRADKPATETK